MLILAPAPFRCSAGILITDYASVYTGRHEDDPWQDGQELNLSEDKAAHPSCRQAKLSWSPTRRPRVGRAGTGWF